MGIELINVDHIQPNPNNPRKNFDEGSLEELAASIREVGILQPLVVTPAVRDGMSLLDTFAEDAQYRIVCGERRWYAAMRAGLAEVPAIVRTDLTPAQEAEIMLVENLQRKDLDPIEEAGAYQALLNGHGYTQEILAAKLGVSQGHIANRLRLLELPETVRENISRGIISASHGKVLAGHKNLPAPMLEKAVEIIAGENVPVAKTTDLVHRFVAENGKPLFDHWNANLKPQFGSGKGSACYECEHRAMGADMSYTGNEQPYCLNVKCWESKQEEAQQKKLEKEQRALAGKDIVDISKLNWDQYGTWREGATDYDQGECHDCEHRKLGKRQNEKPSDAELYCFDPACMKKKRLAMTKINNKKAKDAFQVELQDIAEMAKSHVDTLLCNSPDGVLAIGRTSLIYLAAQVLANVSEWHDRKITLFKYLKEKHGWDHDVLKRGAWGLLNNDWDLFHRLLETLDERQLLELIFEWPAVARGMKGAEGWFLRQVPVMEPEPEPELATKESSFDVISVVTGRVKRCRDCANINKDRICSAFGFERVSLTNPQHCQHYKLRGDVDIESIPRSAEELNQEIVSAPEPRQEQGPDPVQALKGHRIKTNYGLGGVVTNVTGPSDDGTYTVECKGSTDRELSVINHVSLKDDPILRYGFDGKPEVFLESDEPGNAELPARRYLDKNGREIFVSTGLGGSEFGTFWQSPAGGKHRAKSPAMLMTPSKIEAQKNLDAWAEKNGLQPAGGDEPCKRNSA